VTGNTFVEVGYYQTKKNGQGAEGDVFLSRKTDDGRIISVLSDGLGSGIKAGVLATLTATMAVKFIAEDIPIRRAAGIIMKTLPVCKDRRISYATFTIVDIDTLDQVRIIEYDNPPYILIRQQTQVEPLKGEVTVANRRSRAAMQYSEFAAQSGDRLIFFSDGVSQSGMGSPAVPLGWGSPAIQSYALRQVADHPDISARELSRRLVKEAESHDAYEAKDDITCAVAYFRRPRKLLVMTGPSVDPERDGEMAEIFSSFPGRKLICGGTTANILSRELGVAVTVSLKNFDPSLPPSSEMEGADLVTEGIITLGRVAEILERGAVGADKARVNPALRVVEQLLDSDQIDFVVGTKINEAHQDPTMPVELEIRRNIVKRIAALLEEKHLKETSVRYI